MHCINYAKREQEKPLLLKLTLRLRSTLSQAQSAACHELLVVFGLSTLNSNRTNHKTRKKLANQKRRHMSLPLCGVRTLYCATQAMKKECWRKYSNQITECTFLCPEANIWPGSWAFFHVTGRFAFANFIYIFTLELLFYEFLFSLPWLPLVVQFGHGIMLFKILTLKSYAS